MPDRLESTLKVPAFLKLHAKSVLIFAVSFGLYFLCARLGLSLATISEQASPVWPATGIAIGLGFFFGTPAFCGVFAGAILANLLTGLTLSPSAMIGVGNTLEALLAVRCLSFLSTKEHEFGVHARSIFSVISFVAATLMGAVIGSTTLYLFSVIEATGYGSNLLTWWIGDLLGALLLFPVLHQGSQFFKKGSRAGGISLRHALTLLILASGTCVFVFSIDSGAPFLFLVFFVLLYAIIYLQSFCVSAVTLLISTYAIWQTMHHSGPFAGPVLNDSLLHLQIFLAGFAITAIGLASLKQEGLFEKPKWILVFGWALSGVAFHFTYTAAVQKDELAFTSKTALVQTTLEEKMKDIRSALEAGVGFFSASDHVSENEWSLFAQQLRSRDRLPGLEGLGVIFSSSIKQRLGTSTENRYQPARPWKFFEGASYAAVMDHFIIKYIEPLKGNSAAQNLDIASETRRYEAALKARDSGIPTISRAINLVQDNMHRSGFLVFAPLFAKNMPISTEQERRQAHLGFVYAPIVLEKFVQAVFPESQRELAMGIFDDRDSSGPLYQEKPIRWIRTSSPGQGLQFFDRELTVQWGISKKFIPSASLVASWIGLLGAIGSLLLAIALSSVQLVALRAEKLAVEMSRKHDERRRVWQALTETSPVGIIMFDPLGSCTYTNSEWERLCETSKENLLGAGWKVFVHPEDETLFEEMWHQLLQGIAVQLEFRLLVKGQLVKYVAWRGRALFNEQEQIEGFMGTALDITTQQENQLALVTSSRLSSLGEMASGVAHEINNPLAIIQGRAYLIERTLHLDASVEKDRILKSTQQIVATVQRVAKIVRGLRSLSRDTSEEPFEIASVDEAIEDALEMCREKFKNNGVDLEVDTGGGEGIRFWGRSEQISQVVLNLLSNAFDAAQASQHPWVRIGLSKTENEVLILIQDSGPGVPAEIQSKIFDPFFTSKEVGKGTGLGLSISSSILKRHGGRLVFDRSHKQTTFIASLPIMTAQSDLVA